MDPALPSSSPSGSTRAHCTCGGTHLRTSLAEGAAGRISSLAVDVEPTVFWDGNDATARVVEWKQQVGFVDGDDGHGTLMLGLNGPSGRGLDSDYFRVAGDPGTHGLP